ncbi:MAG: WD40 repeat domain-containing protein [Chloroflexota bacterium]
MLCYPLSKTARVRGGGVLLVLVVGMALWWLWPTRALVATHTEEVPIAAVAVRDPHELVVAGTHAGELLLWQPLRDEAPPIRIAAHGSEVRALALSPDGQHLVSGDHLGTIILWDVQHHQTLTQRATYHLTQQTFVESFEQPRRPFWSIIETIRFSRDGALVAISGAEGQVLIVEVATGMVRHSLRVPEIASDPVQYQRIMQVAFDQAGTRLGTGTIDNQISLWDVASGDLLVQWSPWDSAPTRALHFYPTNEDIVLVTQNETSIWSTTTQQRRWSGDIAAFDVPAMVFHPQQHVLARAGPSYAGTFTSGLPLIGQPDGMIYLERLNPDRLHNQEGLCRIPDPKTQQVRSFSPCPQVETLQRLRGHRNVILDVAFSADGQWLVSGSRDQTVRLWRVDVPTER